MTFQISKKCNILILINHIFLNDLIFLFLITEKNKSYYIQSLKKTIMKI